VFLDTRRGRAYKVVALAWSQRSSATPLRWRRLDLVPAATGATTSLFVSEIDGLFVDQRARLLRGDAAIRVVMTLGRALRSRRYRRQHRAAPASLKHAQPEDHAARSLEDHAARSLLSD
jgi:hypothetical protein